MDFSYTTEQQMLRDAVAALGKRAAARRIGIRWRDLDHVRQAASFTTPMLVIHGTDDLTVPFETSRRFALARPDLVQLVAVPGTGHARSWNRDPDVYAFAVEGFLDRVSRRRSAPSSA